MVPFVGRRKLASTVCGIIHIVWYDTADSLHSMLLWVFFTRAGAVYWTDSLRDSNHGRLQRLVIMMKTMYGEYCDEDGRSTRELRMIRMIFNEFLKMFVFNIC